MIKKTIKKGRINGAVAKAGADPARKQASTAVPLKAVKTVRQQARSHAFRIVSSTMVMAYRDVRIILCSGQNESVIKYSVLKESKRLFSAHNKLFLPTGKELEEEWGRERSIIEQRIRTRKSKS